MLVTLDSILTDLISPLIARHASVEAEVVKSLIAPLPEIVSKPSSSRTQVKFPHVPEWAESSFVISVTLLFLLVLYFFYRYHYDLDEKIFDVLSWLSLFFFALLYLLLYFFFPFFFFKIINNNCSLVRAVLLLISKDESWFIPQYSCVSAYLLLRSNSDI